VEEAALVDFTAPATTAMALPGSRAEMGALEMLALAALAAWARRQPHREQAEWGLSTQPRPAAQPVRVAVAVELDAEAPRRLGPAAPTAAPLAEQTLRALVAH